MKILGVLILLCVVLMGPQSRAEEVNALTRQCQHLAHLDAASIKELQTHNPPDDLFKDESFDGAYLRALRQDSTETQRLAISNTVASSARAGILLAGIVRHDLPMVVAAYSASSAAYFTSKSTWPLLTIAASCGFNEGVFFLLREGIDPNSGHDLGAFNAALVVDDYEAARGLLKAGYSVNANEKRCRSSNFILKRNEVSVPADLKATIKALSCPANSSAREGLNKSPFLRDNSATTSR
jgi:hypothetical protein